jgi:hypothetical protein
MLIAPPPRRCRGRLRQLERPRIEHTLMQQRANSIAL